jgi:hypothetical protein
MVESYFTDVVRLQEENQRLKEELGFLMNEFDRIHKEIQEPLKLLAAGPVEAAASHPEPQPRTFLDRLLGRNKTLS